MELVNKYEKHFVKAIKENPKANWMETSIAPLAVDIEEYTGEPVSFSGPFGLRSEVLIQTETRMLILTLWFDDEHNPRFYYDTGKKNGERYPEGSIGYLNNMDNEIAPLPDTIEEIVSSMLKIGQKTAKGNLLGGAANEKGECFGNAHHAAGVYGENPSSPQPHCGSESCN